MSTPYWGQLPSPKIVKNRRMSDDDPHSSLDGPAAYSYNPQHHRASVQTAVTEAPTETTFSPSYESPAASNVAPHGLAPRPPSYQQPRPSAHDSDRSTTTRAQHPYQPRSRLQDIQSEEYIGGGEEVYQNLPLDPEATRGPSGSYHPHGNGSVSHNTQRVGAIVVDDEQIQMEEPPSQHGHLEHAAHQRGYGGDPGAQDPVMSGSRRRKNMTKEEKRARIEAAERRARERQALKAGNVSASQPSEPQTQSHQEQYPPPQPQSQPRPSQPQPQSQPRSHSQTNYSSRDYQEPTSYVDSRPTHAAVPAAIQSVTREVQPHTSSRQPAASHAPVQQHQHRQYDDDRDYDYGSTAPAPRDEPRIAPAREVEQHEVPRRNLSFRERAARDDLKFPSSDEGANVSTQEPAPKKGFGFSLTRSGSNKLKKSPPGDPWYFSRKDAEKQEPVAAQRNVAATKTQRPYQDTPYYPLQGKDAYSQPAQGLTQARRPSAVAPVIERAPATLAPANDIQPLQRRATEPSRNRQQEDNPYFAPATRARQVGQYPQEEELPTPAVAAEQRKLERQQGDDYSDESHQHRITNLLYNRREQMQPGEGLYKPPVWLDEWKKATVGKLSGSLIDMSAERVESSDQNKAWWEESGRRRSSSYASRPRKADTYNGEYEYTSGPTRFKPQLYVECGPLLRYCGIRQEKVPARTRGAPATVKEMWRGSIMIVTKDTESSYETAPTLRLFVQNLELLPTPPHQVNGDLSPEYVDPIAGHPKLGRRGETLFVRPVEHLEEGKDISQNQTDNGLFETKRSGPDLLPPDGAPDWPGTFTSRMKRVDVDGERLQKFTDVKAFKLHAEYGCTFWRFNIEVELSDKQQRIAYRINKGPSMGFWVPAKETGMNVMFHSCNGFSIGTKRDLLSGPDPMWRDVLNNHQTSPFHVMVGGGDQIYNDAVADDCDLLIQWLEMRNPLHKHNAPFTQEMQVQLEVFYFRQYCGWFSSGLFGLASSQIPMVNIWSDRESFNGFGSFPHRDMNSPVLSGLGAVAFKYYMLFQHQSIIPETEVTEPSWVLGTQPGPYVNEVSRNVYVSLGSKMALLAADCRTERTEEDVIHHKTWERIMNRLYAEVKRGQVEHLLVVFPVPVAYPRLAWLENVLSSRVMNPVKALGRKGLLGNSLNKLDDGVEVLDDLRDHWTAKNHKEERQIVIEDLQDLAIDKSVRVTILSGDVNLAAVGQFYSNPKLGLPKHKDPRYIPNIISSAIANAPPPDIMADALNRRHKVHHFDKQTDESMIPMFQHGVDGKPRNNKRLLPHRNWCSIRQWQPGTTPPPTPPPMEDDDESPSPPPEKKGGLLRRLSLGSSERPNMSRDSVRGPRPPVSGAGLLRSISRRLSRSEGTDGERPAKLTRSMSWGRGDNQKRGGIFGFVRRGSQSRPQDDGGINGRWGEETEDEDYDEYDEPPAHTMHRPRPSGLRGGAAYEEYSDGDDSLFTARPPQRANTLGSKPTGPPGSNMPAGADDDDDIPPQALRPFHRTPTGLSTKQMKKSERYEVDLEGGLDVCLNVEVNPKDPTGITVPYRLLIPKLFYEYTPETDQLLEEEPSRLKKLLSIRKKKEQQQEEELGPEEEAAVDDQNDDDYDEEYDDGEQQQQRPRGFGRFFKRG